MTLTQHSRKVKAVEPKETGLIHTEAVVGGGIAYRGHKELPRGMQMFHMLVWL